MKGKRGKKGKKGIKIFIAILLVIAIAVGGAYAYKVYFKKEKIGTNEIKEEKPVVVEKKTVQTFKENDRPIAVMIDNHKGALPHDGLSKAYMVYEIIVEGGESRLMALFKGANVETIGPVRSSRHYFLDYALENDAIYVHFGWSPQAQNDIKSLGINNINGIYDDIPFWRVKNKQAPHNAMTSTEKILEDAQKKGYRTTSDVDSILKYSVDEINLEQDETLQTADTITIPYFNQSNTVKWEYNSELKRYERYTKGVKEIEEGTGDNVTAKNIIIEFIKNSTISGDNAGRQTLNTLGNHEGYYITNGKAIKINCAKTSRQSKTEYTDLKGNTINVNDGNTFVQICPIDAKVEIGAYE